nr:transcription initiation factor IIF subunit alpha [Tanacetum cinerariifolium]
LTVLINTNNNRMSFDLILKPCCDLCGSSNELYGSNCKHMTLCIKCGKLMAERKDRCRDCGITVTRLVRKSGDRHQPTSQQSNHRNHGHNNDHHGSDRRSGGDNHRSNNDYSGNNKLNFKSISVTIYS